MQVAVGAPYRAFAPSCGRRRGAPVPAQHRARAARCYPLQQQRRRQLAASATAQQGQHLASGFDLPLAIALAAAAFEAYLEPIGADEKLQEVLLNNTHVTYTSRDFVLSHFDGLLQLTIHGAKGLKAVNITGGSDPYVVATLGDSSATTQPAWGELSPAWGETRTLYVADRAADLLRLRVRDKNRLVADVDLGAVAVAVADLLAAPGQRKELQLRGANAQGTLTVSAEFLPFDEELTSAAVAQGTQVPQAASAELSMMEGQLEAALAQQPQPPPPPAQPQQQGKQQQGKQQQAPALAKVVVDAKQQAVKSLETALDKLEGNLRGAGRSKEAAAVAANRGSVVGKVGQAADAISGFVQSEGLADLRATDLAAIISKVASSRSGSGSKGADGDRQQQQQAPQQQQQQAPQQAPPQLSPEAMPGAWKALASVAGKMVEGVFTPVAFVENEDTDTEVWIHVSQALREVVVAFRGTEQVKWKDFVSDANLIPQTLDVERTGGISLNLGTLPLGPLGKFKKDKELMVHSGFLAAYDSVKAKVLRLVDQLTEGATEEQPWRVFVTGHSLGGALATLCAYDLAGRRGPAAVGREVAMYTFGAPRVGNRAFADAFNARLGSNSWRVTNSADIVPSVPRLMGYAHVRTGVRLDGSGRLVFEETKDVLGEGREVAEVISDLASQALEVAQGSRALEDVVDAIQEHEMGILNALVDGSALGQHMEDFYLATLKEAVLAADPALAGRVLAALESAAAAAPAGGGKGAGGA